jgi:O-acetylhomoserine/O-acetylserine sulfhydrylase-like pyridoxal-dependent enzyme
MLPLYAENVLTVKRTKFISTARAVAKTLARGQKLLRSSLRKILDMKVHHLVTRSLSTVACSHISFELAFLDDLLHLMAI